MGAWSHAPACRSTATGRRPVAPGQGPALLAELDPSERRFAGVQGGGLLDVRGRMPLSVPVGVGRAREPDGEGLTKRLLAGPEPWTMRDGSGAFYGVQ